MLRLSLWRVVSGHKTALCVSGVAPSFLLIAHHCAILFLSIEAVVCNVAQRKAPCQIAQPLAGITKALYNSNIRLEFFAGKYSLHHAAAQHMPRHPYLSEAFRKEGDAA